MANEDVGGYDLPVVLLVSPWCISACDNQAFLMKGSKRVTLIGEPANGTGAGFWGNKYHDTSFIDPLFIIRSRIPNYLFGHTVETNERVLQDDNHSLLFKLNSENRPTIPDVEFEMSAESYTNGSADWIAKAIEVINGPSTVVPGPNKIV